VATALYASGLQTFWTAAVSSAALLGIYYSRGLEGPVGWGQASLHAAFIVLISLFVNSIARLVMQMKATGAANKPSAKSAAPAPATVETSREQKLAA
jgi:hypothetical protein